MKKLMTLLGSLLLFTGLKAQKDSMIKKETTPPLQQQQLPAGDSLKNSPVSSIYVKKSNTVVMKEKAVLPVKGIIIPDTDKPVKGSTVVKPSKG